MKKKKMIALLAAAVAVFATWQMLGSLSGKEEVEIEYRQVVVASAEIAKGEIIESGKLSVKEIPAEFVPAGALVSKDEAEGQMAQSGIIPGEILTPVRITRTDSGQAGLAYIIPENQRAITLMVETDTGVGGLILPGNQVDLMISLKEPGAGTLTAGKDSLHVDVGQTGDGGQGTEPLTYSTLYLLEDVSVLACGTFMNEDHAQAGAEQGVVYTEVTLAVSREQAREIELYTYMAEDLNGNIRMTLRPAKRENAEVQAAGTETGNTDGV